MDRILEKSQAIEADLIALRRHFHRHPELGGREEETSARVAEALAGCCGAVARGVGGHGVVAVLDGGMPGPTLALRADMDALPLQEESEAPYRSTVPGVAHACGHDAHTAILLGAARVLAEYRFPGRIKFIFQPAEECLPEGGAEAMLAAGVLDDPPVDAMFALHVSPQLPVGQIAVPRREVMAGGDVFTITVRGSGAHGALPHTGVDAVVAAAQAVVGLQAIVSRAMDAREAAVVSVCGVRSSSFSNNVLPETVRMEGTVRYTNPERAGFFEAQMRRILAGVGQQSGSEITLEYRQGYPPAINDSGLAEAVARWSAKIVAPEGIDRPTALMMSSEDVSRFFRRVPGCYLWLGAKPAGRDTALHNPGFDIDEGALALGCALLVNNSLCLLNEPDIVKRLRRQNEEEEGI